MSILRLCYYIIAVNAASLAIVAILVEIDRIQRKSREIEDRRERIFGRSVT